MAVADPSEAAQTAMRGIVAAVASFKTPDELLAAARPDVVHIITPPASHAPLAQAALEAGCHIYVEKPFTERVEDAQRILDEARAKGLLVCAGHQLLYEPPTRVLARYLPSIGQVAHVESYFSFRTVRHAPGGRTVLRADHQLLDILPHPVYLLLLVLEQAGNGTIELVSLELSQAGTVHALVRRGGVTGTLVVTLEGRPVESYLRAVGRNGSLFADYVRSTVQRAIGPGSSGIDKLFAPYRQAWQLLTGTTAAMARRFLKRQQSYPGLAELFSAFYESIRSGAPSPLSPESLLETVRICEKVAQALREREAKALAAAAPRPVESRGVIVTGGTGFLGKEIVRSLLARNRPVRVVARREPSPWERIAGAEYVVADVATGAAVHLFKGADTVIHAAAETAGGWDEHRRNSLNATEQMVRGAAAAGITRFIHISSLAVLAQGTGDPIGDNHPLEPDSKGSGPYVWGKLESERLAVLVGNELGLSVKVVRPGALVDYRDFDPPGRLGKRLGNIFVAVGSPSDRLGVVDVGFSGRFLAWTVDHWDDVPSPLNLLDPVSPTKRELLDHLRKANPDLTVIWLPRFVLIPLSWTAMLAQKLLRPGKPPINIAKVFSVLPYDTSLIAKLAPHIPPQ
ncbi:NAD-dependent epimerase/dehydratase family protein [Nitrospira tepida]|uniref:NAD-dependent epimerase/dehydratase family protein n=1 Tax=Nitrospira tepida TaxID=2973512 RepID=A0AA86T2E8_9BACT|nr:NAD-dependent epimerase/dehydratase family protein [Nitrospira tepida]